MSSPEPQCKLTECQGQPRCATCRIMDGVEPEPEFDLQTGSGEMLASVAGRNAHSEALKYAHVYAADGDTVYVYEVRRKLVGVVRP